MRLTKHTHACVTLEQDGGVLLLDPGTFTPAAAGLLETATAVLVTHIHPDHVDVDLVRSALARRPDLVVHGPSDVVAALDPTAAMADRVRAVEDGDSLEVAGMEVEVVGGPHAPIHEGIAVPHNVGYVVDGTVYHPGDAYRPPRTPVPTLLLPVSGPWSSTREAIDFVVAARPQRSIAVHDVMLSETGLRSAAMFLGEQGLTGVPLTTLADGDSTEL